MNDKSSILQEEYRARFYGKEKYRNIIWKILCEDYFSQFIFPEARVLDLGCGWGEFINNVKASKKYAMDLNPDAEKRLLEEILFLHQDCSEEWQIPPESLDVVFTSNFLEHLEDNEQLKLTLSKAYRSLKKGGLIICLGPNFRFLRDKYWYFWDHFIPISDFTITKVLKSEGFGIELNIPRFLPYSMSIGKNPPAFLLKLYLQMPALWPLFGRQFLVVGQED